MGTEMTAIPPRKAPQAASARPRERWPIQIRKAKQAIQAKCNPSRVNLIQKMAPAAAPFTAKTQKDGSCLPGPKQARKKYRAMASSGRQNSSALSPWAKAGLA